MKRHLLVVGAVLGVVVQLSAACAPAAPAPAAAPTPAPTSAPAAKPTTAPAAVASPAASPASASASPAASPAAAASPSAAAVPKPAGTSAPAASGPATKLVVSYSERIGSNIANWMAKGGGFFQQNGLDVDLQLIPSANGTAALLAGQTQIASGGGAEALSAISGGADLVVIGNLAPVYPYEFMVPADIKTVQDLKGKRVGVSSAGSSSDIATRVGLKAQGIDPDKDVQIVAVGSLENRTAAMLTGAIQGGVAQPPDTVTLQDKGMHALFDMAAQKLPAVNTGLVVQRTWANANKATVQKYVDSLIQATAKAKQDKAAALAVMKKYYQIDDDRAVGAAYDYFVGEVVPAYPYAQPNQFADAVAQLSEKNPKVKDIDLSKVIDDSFIKDAEARELAGS